jgi:hypothetical protein
MVIQYVVVGTFPNQHKKPFVVMADNPTEAIQKVLAEGNDGFQSLEVMETYCKLTIIGGTTIMTNKSCRYKNALEAMEFINNEMYKWGIQEAIDDTSEPSESFQDGFDGFFGELSKDEQKILLSTLGIAKGLVEIAEKAGHDCL